MMVMEEDKQGCRIPTSNAQAPRRLSTTQITCLYCDFSKANCLPGKINQVCKTDRQYSDKLGYKDFP